MGACWGFVPGDGNRCTLHVLVPLWGFSVDGSSGILGSPPQPLAGAPAVLLDDLGTSPFCGAPLAVMATLVTSASQLPVMTFFTGPLSGFLAYLYTWYCFPALYSLKNKM